MNVCTKFQCKIHPLVLYCVYSYTLLKTTNIDGGTERKSQGVTKIIKIPPQETMKVCMNISWQSIQIVVEIFQSEPVSLDRHSEPG